VQSAALLHHTHFCLAGSHEVKPALHSTLASQREQVPPMHVPPLMQSASLVHAGSASHLPLRGLQDIEAPQLTVSQGGRDEQPPTNRVTNSARVVCAMTTPFGSRV